MSGVVFLPPRRKRRLRSAIVRLRSLVPVAPGRRAAGVHRIAADFVALRVRCRRTGAEHIVAASGTLDVRTLEPLVAALQDALEGGAPHIVLDLTELESIDYAGLDAVLTAHLRACDELKLLFIVPGPKPVQRVLDSARAPFLYGARQGSRPSGRARPRGGQTRSRLRPGLRKAANG